MMTTEHDLLSRHERWLTIADNQRWMNRFTIVSFISMLLVVFSVMVLWFFSPTIQHGRLAETLLSGACAFGVFATTLFYPIAVIMLTCLSQEQSRERSMPTSAIFLIALLPPAFLIINLLVNTELYSKWKSLEIEAGFFGPSNAAVDKLRNESRCDSCGYDLQGNHSGVCPECGRSINNVVSRSVNS